MFVCVCVCVYLISKNDSRHIHRSKNNHCVMIPKRYLECLKRFPRYINMQNNKHKFEVKTISCSLNAALKLP